MKKKYLIAITKINMQRKGTRRNALSNLFASQLTWLLMIGL